MRDGALHFLTYNLGASLLAGVVMAAAVLLLARLLGISEARTRNNLFGLALAKSTLVLAGVGLVLPVPEGLWSSVREQALPPEVIIPGLLVWSGLLVLVHRLVRRRMLREQSEGTAGPALVDRVQASVGRVLDGLERREVIEGERFRCSTARRVAWPRVVLKPDQSSPAMVCDHDPPVLFMPADLVPELDDGELDAVIAHELGHVLVNAEQQGCTARWARVVRLTSPISLALGGLLDREKELACDEVAAGVTGRPETVASALLKTYRFRRESSAAIPATVSHLLPARPLLRQRVRRLARPDAIPGRPSRLRVTVVWVVAGFLLFSF